MNYDTSSQSSYVNALTPNETIVGDKAIKKVMKVNRARNDGTPLVQQNEHAYEKREDSQSQLTFSVLNRGRAMWGRSEKMTVCKTMGKASPDNTPGTLNVDFQPPGL